MNELVIALTVNIKVNNFYLRGVCVILSPQGLALANPAVGEMQQSKICAVVR
jgi:hypothetical protein